MLGRYHKSQNLVPFTELQKEVRKIFIEQKEAELKPGRKSRHEIIQEDLNASAFREFEEILEDEVQLEKVKWERRRVEKLNESLNKSLNESLLSPKPPQNQISDPISEFKPELFKTKVLVEKIRSANTGRNTAGTYVSDSPSTPKPKTPLHKTDSVISNEEKAALFAPSTEADATTPTPSIPQTRIGTRRTLSTNEPATSISNNSFSTVLQPTAPPSIRPLTAPVTPQVQPAPYENLDLKKAFNEWIQKIVLEHKNLRGRLTKYRKEAANAKFCNSLKRCINEQIDVTTSKNFNDIKRISMAHNFFDNLLNGQAVKCSADDSEIRLDLQDEIAMEYTVAWICERYTKLVASDGDLIESIATIFTMLTRLKPFIRDRLVSSVVSNCVLLRMDTDEILKKVIELGNVSAEESSVWLPEEGNKVKLLLKTCFYTLNVDAGELNSAFLINQLLRTALNSPPIPISTCFILTALIQTYGKAWQKMADPVENMEKVKRLVEMDWNVLLMPLKASISKPEAWNVLESRQNVCLQQLRSAIMEVVPMTS